MLANLPVVMFSFQGRLGRLGFVRALALNVLVFSLGLAVVTLIDIALTDRLSSELQVQIIAGAGGAGLFAASVLSQIAITLRRLHDFGWSGKWQFLFLAMHLAYAAYAAFVTDPSQDGSPAASDAIFNSATAVVGVIAIVWWLMLLFRRGTKGDNRYGPGLRIPVSPAPRASLA